MMILRKRISWTIAAMSCLLFMSVSLAVLSYSIGMPAYASSSGTSAKNDAQNVISFFAGLGNGRGEPPRIFDYPLYLIQEEESIAWKNSDTHAHRLKVEAVPEQQQQEREQQMPQGAGPQPTSIFESAQIPVGGNVSFTFKEHGIYTVQSLTDPSLQGKIVVADNMKTMIGSNNNHTITTGTQAVESSPVKVELSWYPASPKQGEATYFRIHFVDLQSGLLHDHVDYTFAILDASKDDKIVKDSGLLHSGQGKEFHSVAFQSKGGFAAVVTVKGIYFTPILPEESRFDVGVAPP